MQQAYSSAVSFTPKLSSHCCCYCRCYHHCCNCCCNNSAWGAIDLHIRRYIRLKTIICLVGGVSCGVIYWALQVQMAWVLGMITFILGYLPNLGPMASTMLPLPLVLLDPDMPGAHKALAFMLPTLVHLVIGNFIEPKVRVTCVLLLVCCSQCYSIVIAVQQCTYR
jgi:AI-2E family transporter